MFQYLFVFILVLPVFTNTVVFMLSMGEILFACRIYVFSTIILFLGMVITLWSHDYWMLPVSYSSALLAGLSFSISILRKGGIQISLRKLILVPTLIVVAIIFLKEYNSEKLLLFYGFPLCMLSTVAILFYLMSLLFEHKETFNNCRYVKSKMTVQR